MRAERRLVVVGAGRDVFVAADKTAFPHALDLALKRTDLVAAALLGNVFINALLVGSPECFFLNTLICLVAKCAHGLHPLGDALLLKRCLMAVHGKYLLLDLVVDGHVLGRHGFTLFVAFMKS